ncbi:MAG: hypothetical protein ACREOW_15350 [Thermodesulfobacteriota bacterium]
MRFYRFLAAPSPDPSVCLGIGLGQVWNDTVCQIALSPSTSLRLLAITTRAGQE